MIATILKIENIKFEIKNNKSEKLENELKLYQLELAEEKESLIIKQNNYENNHL